MKPSIGTLLLVPFLICGCGSTKQEKAKIERGPDGTVAYLVQVEASEPGVKIEANGEYVGTAPTTIKIFGDKDGTFHHFGNFSYIIRALPTKPGQLVQEKTYGTGGWFTREDRIPSRIHFEMNLAPVGTAANSRGPGQAPPASTRFKTGTGFFISDDGYLLTCFHVVDGTQVFVKVGKELRSAEIVKKSQTADLAVLKVECKSTPLPLASSRNVRLGERAYTLGFPNPNLQGQEPKFTEGSISSLTGFQDDSSTFQISVPVQPGNSGGALISSQGEVIGVVVAKLFGAECVGYAVKGSSALSLLEQIPDLKLSRSASLERRSPEEIAELLKQSTVTLVVY